MNTTNSLTSNSANSKQALTAQLEKPLQIGVIGCGYWGPKLVRNLHDLPGVDMALVADLRQDRLDEIVDRYPDVTPTSDYRDLLDGSVDAVVIATPTHTHYQFAREALLAGKHVLVEKPITA
ncbi:MAG: Gfo/Idh/MocA family oxidoreductase, partial [Candidatus Promineifilaceae bacterium]|nr:Gfo/Idh/MocA family oxidoreductase [Candidatus Promineifilaceae bacterium]